MDKWEKWEKLPEWSRWILCWPLILVCTLLMGVVINLIASHILLDSILPDPLVKVVAPALVTFFAGPVFFFFIHLLVPRKPTWVTGLFVFFYTTLGIFAAIRLCVEILSGQFEAGSFFQDALQTIVAVGVTWYWFLYFRNDYREEQALRQDQGRT